MMKTVFFALLWLIVIFFGCSYHSQTDESITPVSYRNKPLRNLSSVGILRRLALMPVELKAYQGKYPSEKELWKAVSGYETKCASYLMEDKGYEIVIVGDAVGQWIPELLGDAGPEQITEWSQQWREESAGKHSAVLIQTLGKQLQVDGILVVMVVERKPWTALDGIMNIVLMDIPLFYNIGKPVCGAWIYETATGNIVWSEERSAPALGLGVDDGGGSDQPLPVTGLFSDLDNAVPLQLTK